MSYDKDLRRARFAYTALGLINMVEAGLNASYRYWIIASASVFWAACCFLAVVMARSQQHTRDEVRVVLAALNGRIEEEENDGLRS